ncbi:MAG: hypothetical protein MUC33_09660 [Desulfobacterales bacterium]|nr:hypothetical protein [Desulfobacterales bacterium]
MIVVGSSRPAVHTEPPLDPIRAINTELEQMGSPLLFTEKALEGCWARTLELKDDRQSAWLLLVRLAEAALFCAGNYADNCEVRAAGDFLVNPREIVVRSRCSGRTIIKTRHGRLSEQLALAGDDRFVNQKRAYAGIHLEVTRPPLLPHMAQTLKASGRVARFYVRRLEEGQIRIADTLAFLAAWQINDPVDLRRRLMASSPPERALAEAHLCRYDLQIFHRIGADLSTSLADPSGRSLFVSPSQASELRLNHLPSRDRAARLT